MSGITPLPLARLRDLLGLRGSSFEQLADDIGRGRSHVSQVLNGHRRGGDTWARIRAVVTDAEWALLLQLEHCATWNNAQVAQGETALVWEMRVECGWCAAPMGFRQCERSMAGLVTHGICPTCYASQLSALDQLAARQVDRDVAASSFASLEISRFDDETQATPAGAR